MDKQGQIDTLNKYKIEREQLIEEITALKANLEKEKSDNKVEVKTLERQMFETTERLQKEMVRKITEAKEQLMAVNDEQLSTTTKLTILQNHQLNVELEFQAKQAEKLVKENVQLQGQLTELKREIELHKQVEGEMAKKCYYYQRLIKKLKVAENEETQKKNQAELIKFLENKLDESAKKYEKFQTEYNKLQTECKKLQEMPDKTKFTRAGLLLVDFLENLLNSPESLQNYKDVFLDIEKLKIVPVERWEKEEKMGVVLVLLKQLQPVLPELNLEGVKEKNGPSLGRLLKKVNIKSQFPRPMKLEEISVERSESLPRIPQQFKTIDISPLKTKRGKSLLRNFGYNMKKS